MESRNLKFSPGAYYVSKAARSEWLEFPDEDFVEVALTMKGKRHRFRFGRIPANDNKREKRAGRTCGDKPS